AVSSAVITLSASAASVAEGGSIIYTATVDKPVTDSPLIINLDNGQTIIIPVGSSSASSAPFVVRADDVYEQGTQTLPVDIVSASGGGFTSITTTKTASTDVTDDADATTLSLSATPTVAEGGNITYTATLSHAAQGAVTVTLSNGETI